MNIVCVSALGTSLATFYTLVVYGFLSILPWFSKKLTVTLSILSCVSSMTIVFIVIDALPENTGDKGLLALPGIFIYLIIIIVLSCFITFTKVPENVVKDTRNEFKVEERGSEDIKGSNVNLKVNEVTVFNIYTNEISIKWCNNASRCSHAGLALKEGSRKNIVSQQISRILPGDLKNGES